MSDAQDFVKDDILSAIQLNELKNNFAGINPPDNPTEGCRWFDTGTNQLKIYRSATWATVGAAADPFPPGSILGWVGGYFASDQSAYTRLLGLDNTVAGANDHLNPQGWWVCDGSEVDETASEIWVGAGRYLPNLTDDRFIQGDTAVNAEAAGGSSTREHTHAVDFATKASGVDSNWYRAPADSGGQNVASHTHAHNWNIASFTSGAASVTENRPKFLACFYIVRVL